MKTLKIFKNNSGVTLLELLIAMFLIVLIIFTGSGIYLSGMNLSAAAQASAQAYRNAQVALMHMQKYIPNCATNFSISADKKTVAFKTYNIDSPNFSNGPTITVRYQFSNKTITFTPDMSAPDNTLTFSCINNCTFEPVSGDTSMLKITIKGEDSDGENLYEIQTIVSAGLSSAPNVYTM